jgi:hypothetical protein
MQPTGEMMTPVLALARFMATGDDGGLAGAFASEGMVVVENFAPFLFDGPGAFDRWRRGFGRHAEAGGLSELRWRFGPAQDFALEDGGAYFVLPTTWTGKTHGRAFSEEGGWAFVLAQDGGRWRIRGYAWAVTSKG